MALTDSDDALLNDDEASRLINVKKGSLRAWRARGAGPPFVRLSARTPRYRRADLIAWLAARTVQPVGAKP